MKFSSIIPLISLARANVIGADCQTDEDCDAILCCGLIYLQNPDPEAGGGYWIDQDRHLCGGDNDAYFYENDDNGNEVEYLFKCKHP